MVASQLGFWKSRVLSRFIQNIWVDNDSCYGLDPARGCTHISVQFTKTPITMATQQFDKLTNSIEADTKATSFIRILMMGMMTVGACVGMTTRPAQAVSLANGRIDFAGGTAAFINGVTPASGNSFDITFNHVTPSAKVIAATGSFFTSGLFNQRTPAGTGADGSGDYDLLSAPTVSFIKPTGDDTNFTYELANDLNIEFLNRVTLTIGSGTKFRGDRNINSVQISTLDRSKSFFTQDGDRTDLSAFSFSFIDAGGGPTAVYEIVASTNTAAVPEPFTIVGTMIGGTAALRMRKKLSDAQQK
jgi:hypothetical protein